VSTPEAFDCVVVGSGPGGYVAAIRASQLGMRTAVVEKGEIGGRCLNVACIPAKSVLRTADVLSGIAEADEFGIEVATPRVDFDGVQARRAKVVKTLTSGVSGLLSKNNIEVFTGTASLTSTGSVLVDETELRAERGVILATGSVRRGIPGIEFGGDVIGTEEAWALTEIPQTMIVVGAGASGAEIASAYVRLGSQVTLFEGLDRVLPTEDVDISRVVERAFSKQGIDVRTNSRYEGETADKVVIASGRRPDVDELGLSAAGVDIDEEGWLVVDAEMRTSVAGVYAIGDLVRGPALAHKASDEGVIAAEAIAGEAVHTIAHEDIPRATFCKPHVASFGLTEAQAREQGYEVTIGKVKYGTVGGGTVYGDRNGVIKIVGDKKYGELLGGHIVGSNSTELIQSLVYARSLEGGFMEIARLPHGHPTVSEAIMEAARAADGWLIHG
jgi:dihydrolipoamide dehydrogenase